MNSPAPRDQTLKPRSEMNDEQAVRKLFQKLLDTWAGGDAEAYADLFTEDADYVAFDGLNQKGREAIVNAHRPLFEKWLKGSRLTGEIVSLRFLSPEVALLHTSGETVLKGKHATEPERASIQSLVAVKQGETWRFSSFHNTRVRPIGGFASILLWMVTDKLWRLFGPKNQQTLEPVAQSRNRRDPAL